MWIWYLVIWIFRLKNLPVSSGDIRDIGLVPRLGRVPGGGNATPYSCYPNILAGKSHGQMSLMDCSWCSHKELDTSEHLRTQQYFFCIKMIIEIISLCMFFNDQKNMYNINFKKNFTETFMARLQLVLFLDNFASFSPTSRPH